MLIKINICNEDLSILQEVNDTRAMIVRTYKKSYELNTQFHYLNNTYPKKLKLHNIDINHDINTWIQVERDKNKTKFNTYYSNDDESYLHLLDLIKIMKNKITKYNNELPKIYLNYPSSYIINSFVDMVNKICIVQYKFSNILVLPEIYDYIIQIYKNIIFDQIISMDLDSLQYIIKYIRHKSYKLKYKNDQDINL